MKKSIFLMAGLVGLALTSCKEDNSLGTMQKNEAPVVVVADGVGIQSLYAANDNEIDLQDYEESINIPLIDIELATTFPAGSTVTGEVQIADNPDFKNPQTIALSAVEAENHNEAVAKEVGGETTALTGVVKSTAWNNAFIAFYGLDPTAHVNYLRYKLSLNNGKQSVILYDRDGNEWFDAMEFMVTPFDAKLDVQSAYNLTYTVDGVATTVAMYHNPDTHVYNDPVFNAMVDVPEDAEFTWTISPANDESVVFGVAGDDVSVAEGSLAEGANAGQILSAGTYKIEANMLEKTFTVQIAPPSLYVISLYGVSFTNCSQLETSDYITYTGMAGILGRWGLTGQVGYKPTYFAYDPDVEETTASNGTVTGGLLLDASGDPLNENNAIPFPGGSQGLYYFTANLQSLTYTGYACKTLGFCGTINDWGATADPTLSGKRSTYFMEWTGDITVEEGSEWKIRANNDWVVNFGGVNGGSYTTDGTPVELAMDGANFVAPEAGTYTVTVNFRRTLQDGKMTPYTMTVVPAEN